MNSVQKAVFPGMALGILFLIFFTNLLIAPRVSAKGQLAQGAAPKAAQAKPAVQVQANKTANKDAGNCSLSATFPDSVRKWCSLIDQYAKQSGIDANLVASIMLQESGGNPDAYSKSGAVGLLQVMPSDGLAASFQCINGPCFSSRPTSKELYDPETNLEYGTRMLAGLIQKYGDVREALKQYGPMDMGYQYADIVLSILDRYRP